MPTVHRRRKEKKLADRIGTAAREARKRSGLTQEDVAERVGLAVEVYGRMERGACLPSTPTLFKICQSLQVSADTLLGLGADGDETPPQPVEPDPSVELTPDFRRLRRTLRTMDALQLSTFWRMADVLLTFNRKRQDSQHTPQEATT